MFSADHLAPYLSTFGKAPHIYVGFSGGMDSHVLLHSVAAIIDVKKITAVHINHNLSVNALGWQQHCELVASSLNINIQSFSVDVDTAASSLEQSARNSRYQVFESLLKEGDLLLLGHHADDQAETVLYRLMRSSGPKGLAGIPVTRKIGDGQLLRPLLEVSRDDLLQYAETNQLSWVEDDSNEDVAFDRNFLRHNVVTALLERWPEAISRINTTAHLCGQAEELNQELALQDFDRLIERKERLGFSIELPRFKTLSVLRQNNVIRYWLQRHDFKMPPQSALLRLNHDLIDARDDASPRLVLGDCELRRFNNRLFLLRSVSEFASKDKAFSWDLIEELIISKLGKLVCLSKANDQLTVRFRQGGERCQPKGRAHSQTLKKLFQESELEPWLRDRIPLIFNGDNLVAVAGLFQCEGFDSDIEFSWFD
jgi:tRNA(Ile)-lysidine synthase